MRTHYTESMFRKWFILREGVNQAPAQEFRGAGLSSTSTGAIWVLQAALILEMRKEAAIWACPGDSDSFRDPGLAQCNRGCPLRGCTNSWGVWCHLRLSPVCTADELGNSSSLLAWETPVCRAKAVLLLVGTESGLSTYCTHPSSSLLLSTSAPLWSSFWFGLGC